MTPKLTTEPVQLIAADVQPGEPRERGQLRAVDPLELVAAQRQLRRRRRQPRRHAQQTALAAINAERRSGLFCACAVVLDGEFRAGADVRVARGVWGGRGR